MPKAEKLHEANDATPVTARVPAHTIQALDAWIADQPDPKPGRAEAICAGLNEWLTYYRLDKNRPPSRPNQLGRPKKTSLWL